MATGSFAKFSGSGQAIPSTTYATLDVGPTEDADAGNIVTENAGVFTPSEEGVYLILATGNFNLTHNNRLNIVWQIMKNGTNIAGTAGSGYGRNTNNPYVYVRCGAILEFNGTTDTFSVQHKRDSGEGGPAGTYDFTRLKLVKLGIDLPYGRYGTPTSGAYGGNVATAISGWDAITETDTSVIELQAGGTAIRLKEANRPYLVIYALQNSDAGSNRTTRVSDVTLGGTRIPHSVGYAYQRNTNNQNAVPFGMALVYPTSANQDINIRCWGYDDDAAVLWGTFDDQSWTLSSAAAEAGVMVVALPDSANIAIYEDNTGGDTISGSATSDINIAKTTLKEDSPFSRTANTTIDVTSATDVIAWGASMIERTASSGTRNTQGYRWKIEGVVQSDSEYGNYLRGEQAAYDTKNMVLQTNYTDSVNANDTFTVEKFDPGTDDGANDETSYGGAFFIDLQSLEVSVGGVGEIKYYNGSSFESKPVKYWNGSTWEVKPIKYWTGSQWATMGTAPDTTAPTAPTNLTATNPTLTTMDLAWDAATDNVGVTDYEIFVDGGSVGLSGGALTYQVTGLTNGTSYDFTVKAKDAAGNSSPASNTATNSTNADVTAPSVPTGLATSNVAATSMTLSWTASTDDVGVTDYEIFVDSVSDGLSGGATTYNITGLTAETSYDLTVRARDAAGNWSSQSAILSETTTAAISDPILAASPGVYLHPDDLPTGADGTIIASWPDSSGNSLTPTSFIDRPTLYNGLHGKEVRWDGTNDYLEFPIDSTELRFHPADPQTILIRLGSTLSVPASGGFLGIIGKKDSARPSQVGLVITSNNDYAVFYSDDAWNGNYSTITTVTPAPFDLIFLQLDGAGFIRVYINGSLEDTINTGVGSASYYADYVTLGDLNSYDNRPFDGDIGLVAIWSREITTQERTDIEAEWQIN